MVKPCAGGLLQAIEGFAKKAHIVRPGGTHEARRLSAIHLLLEIAVEECILHVKLVNGPWAGRGNAKHNANGGRFDNRAECLIVVDALPLSETLHNPMCLVQSQGVIRVELVAIYPLAGHHINTCRSGNQILSRILD